MKPAPPQKKLPKKLIVGAGVLLLLGGLAYEFAPEIARQFMGAPRLLLTDADNHLRFIRISGDGRVLAATGDTDSTKDPTDGTLYLWDAQTLKPLPSIPPNLSRDTTGARTADPVFGITFSNDGQKLGFARQGYSLLDLKTHNKVWSSPVYAEEADFSPDGKRLVLSSDDELSVLDASTGKILKVWKNSSRYNENLVLWAPNSRDFAFISGIKGRDDRGPGRGGKIELRDPEGNKPREIGSNFTTAFNFSPDGKRIVCVGEFYDAGRSAYIGNSTSNIDFARCYDLATGRLKWERISDGSYSVVDQYRDAIYSPDGKSVAVHAVDSHQVLLLDAETGREIRSLPIRFADDTSLFLPHSLAFSADGKRLFARGRESVLVWDLGS